MGVEVRLDYSDYAGAFGGGWGERLEVWAFPACYATDPELDECSTGVPVEMKNDEAGRTVTFDTMSEDDLDLALADAEDGTVGDEADSTYEAPVPEPSEDESSEDALEADPAFYSTSETASFSPVSYTTGSGVVYAVSGASANYASTPLSSAATWQSGVGTGDFTYRYPFNLPAASGGRTPELALRYSSAAVDAMSLAENGQAGPAGIGWDLSVGYISRRFAACADDGLSARGDFCWRTPGSPSDAPPTEELTLVLGDTASQLVLIPGTNDFRLRNDPGWKVERFVNHASVSNADDNNEAFKVTTQDGTVYWFGRGNGSRSVWTMPVYGNDPGEPCYSATKAAGDRWCQQAWQWNLDYVEDTNGNRIEYDYEPEINYYGRWASTGTGNRTKYDRGGKLTNIDYGFSRATPSLARQSVTLGTISRCTKRLADPTDTDVSCQESSGPRAKPSMWPDVPADLICDANQTSCGNFTPTFFSLRAYDKIKTFTTEGPSGATTQRNVDDYTLRYTLPDPDGASGGDESDLWLNQILREVGDGNGTVEVNFNGVSLKNRVKVDGSERTLKKFRVESIRNETGGRINVTYGHAEGRGCDENYVTTSTGLLDRWKSDRECFAQKFAPPGAEPKWEWFHKFVVKRLAVGDGALGLAVGERAGTTSLGKLRITDYDYLGAPGWRYVKSRNALSKDEAWSDWRGYETTLVNDKKTADGYATGVDSTTRVVRFRGMNGVPKSPTAGDIRTEAIVDVVNHDGVGTDPQDQNWFEGRVAQETVLDAAGNWIRRTTHKYNAFPTVDQPIGANARLVYESEKLDHTALPNGNARTRGISYTVNDGGGSPNAFRGLLAGAVLEVKDDGELGLGGDTVCEVTTWKTNSTLWLRKPQQITTFGNSCSEPSARVAQQKFFYDNEEDSADASFNNGRLTATRRWKDSASYVETKSRYDDYGRITVQVDGEGNRTETWYNGKQPGVTSGDLITSITTKNAKGHLETKYLSARRGQVTRIVDANNRSTDLDYDWFGRLRKVWLPGISQAETPSIQHTYNINVLNPSSVKTTTRRASTSAGAVTDTAYTFYDGWGRPVESQVPQADGDGGRVVSATGYDEQGRVRYSMPAIINDNAPGSPLNPDPAGVKRYTRTLYDAAGRVESSSRMSDGAALATTTTDYSATTVTTEPPVGGDTVTRLDVRGRTTTVEQYNGAASAPGGPVSKASYTYDGLGNLAGIASISSDLDTTAGKPAIPDVAESQWSFEHDWLGRRTKATDPDTGMTTYTYDDADNLASVDAAGSPEVTYDYDQLNRPTRTAVDSGVLMMPSQDVITRTYDNPDPTANGLGRPWRETRTTTRDGKTYTFEQIADRYNVRGDLLDQTYTYPASLSGETVPAGTTQATKTYSHSYNDGGQVTQTVLPASPVTDGLGVTPTLAYSYTTNGLPESQTIRMPDGSDMVIAQTSYDQRNRPDLIESINGASPTSRWTELARAYSYESESGWLESIKIASGTQNAAPVTQRSLAYTYDLVGNPRRITGTAQTAAGTAQGSWCYTYDGLNRLKTASTGQADAATTETCTTAAADAAVVGANYALTYEYGTDRIKSVTAGNGARATYTYPTAGSARPHAATQVALNGSAVGLPPEMSATGYDDGGRLLGDARRGTSNTYDGYGNLASVTSTQGTGGTTTNFFDANLLRAARVRDEGGTRTAVIYLPGMELKATGTPTGTLTPTAATRTFAASDGAPLASYTGASRKWTWIAADAQHSVRLTKSGSEIRRHDYLPFGQLVTPANDLPADRGYLNKPLDPGGAVQLDHRSYQPDLNVLTTPDPLLIPFDPQNLNPYSYARNNPLTYSDPSGLVIDHGHDGTGGNISGPGSDFGISGGDPEDQPIQQTDVAEAAGTLTPTEQAAEDAREDRAEAQRSFWGDLNAARRAIIADERDCFSESASGWACAAAIFGVTPLGKGVKAARAIENLTDASKYGDEIAGGIGDSRTYTDLTKGGSIRNVGTNATHTEFADNLTAGGWIPRTSKDGAVRIFQRDGAKYVLRERADSYGGWTADFTPVGSLDVTLKIRLGYTP